MASTMTREEQLKLWEDVKKEQHWGKPVPLPAVTTKQISRPRPPAATGWGAFKENGYQNKHSIPPSPPSSTSSKGNANGWGRSTPPRSTATPSDWGSIPNGVKSASSSPPPAAAAMLFAGWNPPPPVSAYREPAAARPAPQAPIATYRPPQPQPIFRPARDSAAAAAAGASTPSDWASITKPTVASPSPTVTASSPTFSMRQSPSSTSSAAMSPRTNGIASTSVPTAKPATPSPTLPIAKPSTAPWTSSPTTEQPTPAASTSAKLPVFRKAESTERKKQVERLKLTIYSRTPCPATYSWPMLLKDALVFHEMGIPLKYRVPADDEIYQLLQFEPSRLKLPELAALAETKTKAELDAHRVDPHLLAAAGFVWQSARLTARDVQALAASAEHACLFELVDDFAQVSRIRDLLAKNLGALRTKVRAKEGEIEARKASGALQIWSPEVLAHDMAKAFVRRCDDGQLIPVATKLPTQTDRSLGLKMFPMLSIS